MRYVLNGGEEIRDGKLYGWTGKSCPRCHGTGDIDSEYQQSCPACSGTAEEWGLMPVQPDQPAQKKPVTLATWCVKCDRWLVIEGEKCRGCGQRRAHAPAAGEEK